MIRSHSVTAVNYLCRFVFDVKWNPSERWTAIQIADEEHQPAICRILIDAAADLLTVTRFGFRPLELASGRHMVDLQRETVQLMRERIAAENVKVHDCSDIFCPINDGTREG
jgi:hypothetical protein